MKHLFIAGIFFVLSSLFLFFMMQRLTDKPLGWDEVDYVGAARLGFVNNYIEENSLNLVEYYELSKLKIAKDSIGIQKKAQVLPKESEMLFYLRHFHPVLPVYYWSLFVTDDYKTTDTGINTSKSIFSVVLIILVAFIVFKLLTPENPLRYLVFLITSLIATSAFYSQVFGEINFHCFFAMALVIYIYTLYYFLKSPSVKQAMLCAFALCICYLCLETWVFILGFTVVLVILFQRVRTVLPYLKYFAGFFLLGILMTWPGSYKTGLSVNSFLMYVYRIFFMSNAEYNKVSYLDNWLQLSSLNWSITLVIIAGICLSIFNRKRINTELHIVFCLALMYCLIMTPFILNTTYVFAGVLVLFALSAVFIINYLNGQNNKQYIIYAIVAVLIMANILQIIELFQKNESRMIQITADKKALQDEVAFCLQTYNTKHQEIFIDGAHIDNYYSNANNFLNVSTEFPGQLAVRENYELKIISKNRLEESPLIILRESTPKLDLYLKQAGFIKQALFGKIAFINERK